MKIEEEKNPHHCNVQSFLECICRSGCIVVMNMT